VRRTGLEFLRPTCSWSPGYRPYGRGEGASQAKAAGVYKGRTLEQGLRRTRFKVRDETASGMRDRARQRDKPRLPCQEWGTRVKRRVEPTGSPNPDRVPTPGNGFHSKFKGGRAVIGGL
jgi:hypothetical protein